MRPTRLATRRSPRSFRPRASRRREPRPFPLNLSRAGVLQWSEPREPVSRTAREGEPTMKRHVLVLSILLLTASAAALAETTSVRSCIAEARDELQECSIECVNDFRNERFLCRNVEAGCGRECLGRREGCIETASEPLVACVGVCRTTLIAAKAACVASCNADPLCLDPCIDAAQVGAFTCRDDCREEFRLSGGVAAIEACRATFRECVRACPAP